MMMEEFVFAYPQRFYWLLILIPIIGWYMYRNSRSQATVRISAVSDLSGLPKTYRYYLRHLLFVLRLIVVALLIVVLARPQSIQGNKDISHEGIDIVLAMDISASMLAQDFRPNRLEASKKYAMEFISNRPLDRIGLVVFSGESFTQAPLTTDRKVIINLFKDIKSGLIEGGTAIGLGLANAVNRLKDSEAKSKVVILLTDGVNNQGEIEPISAAEIAKAFGIRVYTIGVGTQGKALSPVAKYPDGSYAYDYVDVEIDEATLSKIAEMTDGKYFRATNNKALQQIYQEIDKMERSKIEVKEYTTKQEQYYVFAIWAVAFLMLEILLRYTIFRQIP